MAKNKIGDVHDYAPAPHRLAIERTKYERCCNDEWCDHREYHNTTTTTYKVTCSDCDYTRVIQTNHYHALHLADRGMLRDEEEAHRFNILFARKK